MSELQTEHDAFEFSASGLTWPYFYIYGFLFHEQPP
jgi:hypothetical protein